MVINKKKNPTKKHGGKSSGGRSSSSSSSNSFSAYNEACDYMQQMWKTGHSLRSLVYETSPSSTAGPGDNNASSSSLICSKRTFAILSNVIKVQESLQRVLDESIPSAQVGNAALLLIMAYELLLSKQQKIVGGGAIKRLLLSHEKTLRAKIRQNDALRQEFERQQQHREASTASPPFDLHNNDSTTTRHGASNVKPYHFRLLVKKIDDDVVDDDDDDTVGIENRQSTVVVRDILQHATPDPLLPLVYETSTIPKARLVAHPNLFLIQSQASCLPAYCLYQALQEQQQQEQQQRVTKHVLLDACAAPGNKTLQLASYFFDQHNDDRSSSTTTTTTTTTATTAASIIALDKDEHRHQMLHCRCAGHYPNKSSSSSNKNDESMIQTIQQDFLQYENPAVTAILLDPSCSGGHAVLVGETTNAGGGGKKKRLDQLAAFQTKALLHALSSFPQCQTVVYSTCSPTLEENEAVVLHCLEKQRSSSSSQQHPWKLITALPEWARRGRDDCGDDAVRAATLRHDDGFFVAVLQRTIEENADASTKDRNTDNNNTKKRRKKQQWKERQQAEAKRRRSQQKKMDKQKNSVLQKPPPPQQDQASAQH